MAGYITGATILLIRFGYSYPQLVKDVVFWFIFSAIALPARVILGDRKHGFIRPLLKDSLGIIVLFEFLIANYTFHILVELPLVLVVTIIFMIKAFSENNPDYQRVTNFINRLQVIFGLVILGLALHHAAFDTSIRQIGTIKQFFLPFILTIAVIPYVYLLLLYSSYEDLFIRIGHVGNANHWVRHYGTIRILWKARFRPSLSQQYLELLALELLKVNSKEDVNRILKDKKVRVRNKQSFCGTNK